MKTNLSQTIVAALILLNTSMGWAIEDSMIFESIDSQNKIFSKIQETNNSQIPEFHKSNQQEIVVEDSQKFFAAKTNSEVIQFDKEKPVKKPSNDLNKKKIERIAQELQDLQY